MDKEADFDMVIQRHLTRAHKLRAIQQIIDEDPDLLPELLEILNTRASAPAGPPRPPAEARRRLDAKTQAEKVVAFFRAHADDDLFTVRDIAEGTGLTRNTVNALLYNSSEKDLFYRIHVGPKRVLWRLRKEGEDTEGEVDDPEIIAEHEEFMRRHGELEE